MSFDHHVGPNWVEVRLQVIFSDALPMENVFDYEGGISPLDSLIAQEKLTILEAIVPICLGSKEMHAYQLLRTGEADSFSHAAQIAGLNKMAVSRMIQKLARELSKALDC